MSSIDSDDSNKRKNIEDLTDNVKKLIVSDDYIDLKKFDDSCRISSEVEEITLSTDGVCISLSESRNSEEELDNNDENESTDEKLASGTEEQLITESVYEVYAHPCFPKINCQEKIVFCIDMSSELEDIPFRKNDGSPHSPLSMVKRTIEFFVHNKDFINKKHEYSLMVLYESATWVREFTNDVLDFIDSLEDLNETQPCDSCDFSSIVQLICDKFELNLPMDLNTVPYIIRVILIYGRSNSTFHFSDQELKELMMLHPLIYLDVLYIHEAPSEENQSKEIFDALCDLDTQNKSYIFEVKRNITKLHNCMAKLLAHPLQRSAQKDACYKMKEIEQQEAP